MSPGCSINSRTRTSSLIALKSSHWINKMVLSTLKRCKTADLKRQSEGCGECNKCWFMSKHLIFYLHRCCAFSSLTAGGWAFGDVWNKCIDWHRFSRFIILTWSCSGLFSQFQITRRAEVSWPVRVNTAFYFKSKKHKFMTKKQNKKTITTVLPVSHRCKKVANTLFLWIRAAPIPGRYWLK